MESLEAQECFLKQGAHLYPPGENPSKGQEVQAMGDVHKIINFYWYNDLFPHQDRRILIPLPSPYSDEVDESSFYIGSDELNANSISDINEAWGQT